MAIDPNADRKTYLGLWARAPEGEVLDYATEAINSFEGQKLTVTVVFEDGHCSTQIIELHAADMKVEEVIHAEGNALRGRVLPEIVDTSGMSEDERFLARGRYEMIRSLYGEVIEVNNNPFPESLEKANEREHILDPPAQLPDRPLRTPVEGKTLEASAIYGPEDTIHVMVKDHLAELNGENPPSVPFDYKLAHAVRSQALPEGVAVETSDVLMGFQNDFEYMNWCFEQGSYGFTLSRDGVLSEGASFMTLTLDITNPSGEVQGLPAGWLGTYIVKDGDAGRFSYAKTSAFHCSHTEEARQNEKRELIFQPGETKRITEITIINDELLDDPSIMLLFGSDEPVAIALDRYT